MTSIAGLAPETARTTATVTVALVSAFPYPTGPLVAALNALPINEIAQWRLLPADAVAPGSAVDIALCDEPAAVRSASRCWPGAEILALVSPYRDESGVVDALDAGAHVCVRGSDSALVAAYLHSIARRRGLFSEDAAR